MHYPMLFTDKRPVALAGVEWQVVGNAQVSATFSRSQEN